MDDEKIGVVNIDRIAQIAEQAWKLLEERIGPEGAQRQRAKIEADAKAFVDRCLTMTTTYDKDGNVISAKHGTDAAS